MTESLEHGLSPALQRLQRFWLWKRGELVREVQQKVQAADARTTRLIADCSALHADLAKVNAEQLQLQSAHATQARQLNERSAAYQSLSAAHAQLLEQAGELRQEFSDLTARHTALQTHQEQTSAALSQSQFAHQTLASAQKQLQTEQTALMRRLAERDAECLQLSAKLATLEETHAQFQRAYDGLTTRHKALQAQHEKTSTALSQSESSHQELAEVHRQLQTEHAALLQRSNERDADYQQLSITCDSQSAKLATLAQTHAQLQAEHTGLMRANERVQERYELVCSILSCEPAHNPALHRLKEWLAADFVQSVQRLELPAKETTHALIQAQAIAQRVELLSDAPALHDKFLVAVAGGFSAGKSSFVASFMECEEALLPTGINPVTAIPTYVMPGERLDIKGHTFKGGHTTLTPQDYGRLTHEFISDMGFNIKEIMPYVVLQARMPMFEHLAFIDMPGYNSAESDVVDTAADLEIASTTLSEADAVLWLLGLDSSGTLPNDEITFLLEHVDASKPLYVVLNKADLRPIGDVTRVMQEVRNILDSEGIACEGISAYSARLGKELCHHGMGIEDMLAQWDQHSSAAVAVHKEFESLMDGLEAASEAQRRNMQTARTLLKSLQLDFYELSAGQEVNAVAAFPDSHDENMDNRTERLRAEVEGRLQKLARTLSIESNDAATVLENSREHGHELLRQSCGARNPAAAVVRGHWEN
ncbi:dynamin family protein [Acidovorax sp. CCYZU-2555]|uniref:dynamin family protein n=1 Tax=Acidovorax sp. CCYZU-2555 TaxID=2835042 RepID=UPI001BD0373B|nr:dynamin family protein [Acidovorax sp. CCYZU-2555]MBS7780105.1 dynamin family protein [Acidovorax sp. CCYZU-2555]